MEVCLGRNQMGEIQLWESWVGCQMWACLGLECKLEWRVRLGLGEIVGLGLEYKLGWRVGLGLGCSLGWRVCLGLECSLG